MNDKNIDKPEGLQKFSGFYFGALCHSSPRLELTFIDGIYAPFLL